MTLLTRPLLARLYPGIVAAVLWLATVPALAQFVGGIEDLPLMPGLTDIHDAGVVDADDFLDVLFRSSLICLALRRFFSVSIRS